MEPGTLIRCYRLGVTPVWGNTPNRCYSNPNPNPNPNSNPNPNPNQVTKQTGLATIALSVSGGKVACLASVPKESVEALLANAWLSTVLDEVSGRGGGKPAQAQGSGPEVANLPKAVEVAREVASKALGA